jgi:hypothetical protein
MSLYSPPSEWVSPSLLAGTRPGGDEPGPGWWGWLTVVALLALLGAGLIEGVPPR